MEENELNENQQEQSSPIDPLPSTEPPKTTFSSFAPSSLDFQQNRLDLNNVANAVDKVKLELSKFIIGQKESIDLLIAALLSGGHVLLEGVPGIAKTLTAKLLARTLSVGFSRIQFTPDLMPTDVVGTTTYNMQTSEFKFAPGPVFSNVILIDEINRAPAKTQASLFEVMEEYQVTVDGKTYRMEFPFFVIATQNPIEQEGTYKLPEAQLDRFLFKINMDYPSLDEEKSILYRFKNDFNKRKDVQVNAVFSSEEIKKCQDIIEHIYIKEDLLDYIASIVYNTRNSGDLFLGASPRASLAMLKASKAIAAMRGRDFVIPEDIRYVSYPVLNHRVILTPEREMEGYQPKDIIDSIVKNIEVPR